MALGKLGERAGKNSELGIGNEALGARADSPQNLEFGITKEEFGQPRPAGVENYGGRLRDLTVEAVVLGARMTMTFETTPERALAMIRGWDAGAVFHTELRSGGGYGKRESKSALCQSVTLKKSDKGLFGDFTCVAADGEFVVVGITKKFDALAKFAGVLGEGRMEQVRGVIEKGGALPLMLGEDERFTVKYWTGDDGTHFVEDLVKG